MTKPWDQTWTTRTLAGDASGWACLDGADDSNEQYKSESFFPLAFAKFISAAPAMARALCMAEYGLDGSECPCCGARPGKESHAGCALDAALTAAGPDAAAREAVRRASK